MHDFDRTQRETESEHQETEHELEGAAFVGSLLGQREQETAQDHEESPLSEAQEMELASELLGASNDADQSLGGMVKGLAKQALPVAASALGGMVGGPLGAKIGGGLGDMASGLFELEGLQGGGTRGDP